jgi:zinc protease
MRSESSLNDVHRRLSRFQGHGFVQSTLGIVAMALFCLQPPSQAGVKFTEVAAPKSPLVSFRIIVRVGSINDPKGKEGLNELTASMLAEGGTQELKYPQVLEKLYPWAATISVQADKEITTFQGKVHRDFLGPFYELFSSLILKPRFDEEDFTRNLDLELNSLEKTLRGSDDEDLGKETLNLSLFAGHPYGTAGATVSGLKSITMDDLKTYYHRYYAADNFWIGVAGGYPRALIDRMKKDFSARRGGDSAEVKLPLPRKIDEFELTLVQKPARATAVSMGHPLFLTPRDKDYYPLLLANSYFGEHRSMNGVLMNQLREERGLNYGDYSYIERFIGGLGSNTRFPDLNTPLRQQYFSIWLRPVPPEKAHFAIRAALYELDKYVQDGLTQEQFEKTRMFLISYSKLWAQTLDRRLGYQMDSEFYGTEYYLDRIEKELNKSTLGEVNRVIKQYISPRNLAIAVVADHADDLMSALQSNVPSPIKYAAPVAEKIREADKAIEILPLAINKNKSKVVPVGTLFK